MGIKRTELIRQIDLWPSKQFFRNKIGQKRQKYRKPNFPLYFWQNPLYFFNGLLGSLNGLKWIFCRKQTLSKIQFYIGIHLSEIQNLNFAKYDNPYCPCCINIIKIFRIEIYSNPLASSFQENKFAVYMLS